MLRSYNPTSKLVVCPLTRSLAATSVISIDFSSCGYLDVSVPRVGPINGNTYRYVLGCPIQKFPDQSPLTAPRDLSQPGTSFIASTSQGIHRSLLVAYLFIFFTSQTGKAGLCDGELRSLNPPKAQQRFRRCRKIPIKEII